MKQKVKICKNCNEPFVATHKRQLYCNAYCRRQYYYRKKNPLEERICECCDEIFLPTHNRQITCSKSCSKELDRIKRRNFMFKIRREFPELFYNELGSKGTSVNHRLYRHKNGKPDFNKERKWANRELKRLHIK